MIITEDQLKKIFPSSTEENRNKFLPYLNQYFDLYEVNTFERICAFMAQVGHESGQLRYVEEIASGKAYENRKDLGNIFKGDGVRFKGRGLIQITGRSNYAAISKDLGVDFLATPDLLKDDDYAVLCAFWYWKKHNLNRFCTLKEDDFKTLTRRINGGLNGYADRFSIWNRAKEILK